MQSPAIAIIEDHPMVRDALAGYVRQAFPGAAVVYSGAVISEAMRIISAQTIDVVILDLDLGDGKPPISNVTTLTSTGIPILIVSALADGPTVRAALIAGAQGYVSKNAGSEEICEAIEATLRGEKYVSHELGSQMLSNTETAVQLSEQERRTMVLYASGLKLSAVARRMDISFGTAQEYVKRVREKYLKAGMPMPTKTDMYRVARDEGLLP